jgi:hypothetical protein
LEVVYRNPLTATKDVAGFRMEGDGVVSFPLGRLRMENGRDAKEGQAANFVLWCPAEFPDRVAVSWDFWPIREPGLAMLFFAARGRGGQDVLDPALARRSGPYRQYHHGDINALHVSYFRRVEPERHFNVCNLRKSYGFHLVGEGADPIPTVADARGPYGITVVKYEDRVAFWINGLRLLTWQDDGTSRGPVLAGGKIGFRQMATLRAEYANLVVERITAK